MKKTLVSLLAIGAMGAATLPLASPAGAAAVTSATVDELAERFGPEVVRDVEMPPVDVGLDEARAGSGYVRPLGQELFSWGFELGLRHGVDELFWRLGFGSNLQAMDEINGSLGEMNDELDGVLDEMRERADAEIWDAFAAAHAESARPMSEIAGWARDVATFERLGITLPAHAVRQIAESANRALVDLGSTLLSPAGTGTIPALVALETNTTRVSDTVEQWDRLHKLVDRYRAAYAQGLLVMLWAAQFDDDHDTNWGAFAQSRVDEATGRTNMIFDYIGAPYPQHPGDVPWIHANGQEWALTNADRQPYRDEHMTRIIEGFDHHLMILVNNYRPTGGETLEQIFHNHGLHTRAVYADQIYADTVRCVGGTCLYRARYLQGKIVGNQRIQEQITFWESWGQDNQTWVDENVIPQLVQKWNEVAANPVFALVHVPVNPNTGMPALMDEESIRAARDGLKDLRIARGYGDDVGVAFDRGDYTDLMIVDPATDEVLATHDLVADPNPGWLGVMPTTAGVVELRLGYAVDGAPTLLESRAVSTIAANPDTNSIDLRVTLLT